MDLCAYDFFFWWKDNEAAAEEKNRKIRFFSLFGDHQLLAMEYNFKNTFTYVKYFLRKKMFNDELV